MPRPVTALLYASLLALAIAGPAAALDETLRTELTELREGDMRKLVFHKEPKPVGDATFTDKEGNEITLAESNGKVRIVNFWATWCAPCRHEKPSLDALNQDLSGPDFEVIAIATGRNPPEGIIRFNDQVGIESLETYLDPKSTMARGMAVIGLPVSVILDRDGNEVARLAGGADWTSDSTRAILDRLIGAGS